MFRLQHHVSFSTADGDLDAASALAVGRRMGEAFRDLKGREAALIRRYRAMGITTGEDASSVPAADAGEGEDAGEDAGEGAGEGAGEDELWVGARRG